MNSIESIRDELRAQLPDATITITPPANPSGSWWLDAYLNAHHVVIEWRPREGFGVSAPADDDYGEGADEIYTEPGEARERVVELLHSGAFTRAGGSVAVPTAS